MINFFRRFKLVSHRLIKKSFSEKYLLLTNCAISISLSSLGDCIEQQYEIYKKEQDQFDKRRNFNMATSGMVNPLNFKFKYVSTKQIYYCRLLEYSVIIGIKFLTVECQEGHFKM